jgi:non-ribosomal peptide synthetase component E (peptide arylation enzyme)
LTADNVTRLAERLPDPMQVAHMGPPGGGGESISAIEIERLISRHPDVGAVAVIPMPDPVMGERICPYIQPKTGAQLTFDKIISFLRGQKASVLQLPERIEFIDAMPYIGA